MVDFTKARLPKRKREYLGHRVRGSEVGTSFKKRGGSKTASSLGDKASVVRVPGQIFKESEEQKEKRLRLHRKKQLALSRFNLNGELDSDEEIVTLNGGKQINDLPAGAVIEDFEERQDDLIHDSDDQADKQMSAEATSLQFGEGGDEAPKKSRKEIYSEIMAKSKISKSEQARMKAKNSMLLHEIDDSLQDVIGELEMRPKKGESILGDDAEEVLADTRTEESKALEDDFDRLTRAFKMTVAAKASDRVKTAAEIAMERKKKLEALEQERLQKLKKSDEKEDEDLMEEGSEDGDTEGESGDGDTDDEEEEEGTSDKEEDGTDDGEEEDGIKDGEEATSEKSSTKEGDAEITTDEEVASDGEGGEPEDIEVDAEEESADAEAEEESNSPKGTDAVEADDAEESAEEEESDGGEKSDGEEENVEVDEMAAAEAESDESEATGGMYVEASGSEENHTEPSSPTNEERAFSAPGAETQAEGGIDALEMEDDWMRNEGVEEENLPLHFSKLPKGFEAICKLFQSAATATGYYKLVKRLVASLGQSAPARDWSEFWMGFLQHLLRLGIDDRERFFELKKSRAWLELMAELQLQPAVCANFASCCIGRITMALSGNENFLKTVAEQWRRRGESIPSQRDNADAMQRLTDTIQNDCTWKELIPVDENGFEQRLLVALTVTNIFSPASEVVQNLLAVVLLDVASHWALSGWVPWSSSAVFTLENIPADELLLTEQRRSIDLEALSSALTTFVCLASMCAPPMHNQKKIPAWMEDPGPPPYRYCIELFQMTSVVIFASCQIVKKSKTAKTLSSTLTTCLDIFDKYLTNFLSPSQAGHLIVASWLEPMRAALEKSREKLDADRVARCTDLFSRYIDLIAQTRLRPMTSLSKRPRGIKRFRAQYVDIRDPDFFAKAKSGGQKNPANKDDDARRLKRQMNTERRGAAKELRRAAEETTKIQAMIKGQHRDHQLAQVKRFESIVQQDAIELKKMRSQGRSMDTKESGPYRAKKKARVAKGGR